ncbi:transposase [Halocatena pleomorpha]|uniref:Transposase n=1 Tax=Halocatena pleomorpha TaxID=1785090 RepID=A0A3P3RKF1_9EURY|nr:transposase [Halocatena pleomorpha]RRJ34016.1 transposase [Halocatena pleomorpha]
MYSVDAWDPILNEACDRLETAPTLVDFVRGVNVARLLRNTDDKRFEAFTYDAVPTVHALFCRELVGLSWNGLYEFLSTEDRAVRLGFDPTKFGPYNTAPTRQTLTKLWDHDLSDDAKRALLSLSERLVDAAYENDDALDLRPPRHVDETKSDLRERHVGEFSDEQIRRHVRHARNTILGAFDSGRAANTTYPDSRFDELQALMALGGCGTPQGQSRMENFFGDGYTPHGDTHLRTVKNYSKKQIQAGFEQSIENLLDTVNHLQILQPPVTVAIDITTWPYYAEDELPREVSGTDDSGERAYKFATLSLVGKSMPIVLAVEPVIESSAWDENLPHQYHRTVRRLIRRAQAFVAIDLVLADRGFESLQVYQTLNNLGVTYLFPKTEREPEAAYIEQMEQEDEDVAVEQVTVKARNGSHDCRGLFVPNENGDIGVHHERADQRPRTRTAVGKVLRGSLVDRSRIPLDQTGVPRKNISEGSYAAVLLFRVCHSDVQRLAAHRCPPESVGLTETDDHSTSPYCWGTR